MAVKALVALLSVVAIACGTVGTAAPQSTDELCAALARVREAGLAASMSGASRIGDEDLADRQAEQARAALQQFRDAAPADIAADADRVTRALERFVTILNDPSAGPGEMLAWLREGPDEHDRLVASAERVNAVTQQRCGEPLVDPAALDQGAPRP